MYKSIFIFLFFYSPAHPLVRRCVCVCVCVVSVIVKRPVLPLCVVDGRSLLLLLLLELVEVIMYSAYA